MSAAFLVLTRGLPASGKTTWARKWVKEDPNNRARVNRDDLRELMFGQPAPLPWEWETNISCAQNAAVRALLEVNVSVVVDDMHLREKYVTAWFKLAEELGVPTMLMDFTHVDVEVCITRDLNRELDGHRAVGATFIRDMHDRFIRGRLPLPMPSLESNPLPEVETYVPNEALPDAWLVDMDGTLALMCDRSPYDYTRVGEDKLNQAVYEVVRALHRDFNQIVVLSGREESARADTEAWLDQHGIPYDALYMRPMGDSRKDAIVKAELFWKYIAPHYRIQGSLDDRDQVVKQWRSMGIPCFQVNYGNF